MISGGNGRRGGELEFGTAAGVERGGMGGGMGGGAGVIGGKAIREFDAEDKGTGGDDEREALFLRCQNRC